MVRNCMEIGLNLQKIMQRLLANQNLIKLLYYNNKNPLAENDIPLDIVNKEIKLNDIMEKIYLVYLKKLEDKQKYLF